jgi:putative phosphoribosyl transferase
MTRQQTVHIGPQSLAGDWTCPARARGAVVFAHGSGSSRLSRRNRWVAGLLQQRGLATLLFDLLTEQEAQDRRNVFDIPLLSERMVQALNMLHAGDAAALPIGLFGASTGAAAALCAAALHPDLVRAVVSRGGRPDLAGDDLPRVRAPTLLIVGGEDQQVLALNRNALAQMRCTSSLAVVPGATHLFEEPGTLQTAADLAADWFAQHLA